MVSRQELKRVSKAQLSETGEYVQFLWQYILHC